MNRPPDTHASDDGSVLAYQDERFLEGDEGRPLRILSEYLRPLGVFRRRKVHDTIVFFGSARIDETGPFGEYYEAARTLARLVTEWSAGLPSPSHRYLVCSGGGPGIMEAANRGAHEAGGRTVGLNIGLPYEQRPNPFITPGLSFEFRYFFMRKLWFSYLARAVVVFPGGYGTMDELFEVLTLSQTGKLERPVPTILYGTDYWREIVDFDALARHGMIAVEDLDLMHCADTPEEALAVLRRRLRPQDEVPEAPVLARSMTPGCDRSVGDVRQRRRR